jgi:hypothetical protein
LKSKKIVIATALIVATAIPALAFLGVEDTVEAGPVWWAQIIQDYQELMAVNNMTTNTWNQLKMDARFIQNKSYWKGVFSNILNTNVQNQRGETTGWNTAVDTSANNANQALTNASIPLKPNPNVVLGTAQSADMASAEIGAGSIVTAMNTLGNVRVTQQQMAQPIQNCENSALSTNAGDNTSAAQQNISNACQVLGLRQQQSAISLQASQAELQIAATKPIVDSETEYSNMIAKAQAAQSPTLGNMADSITNRDIP